MTAMDRFKQTIHAMATDDEATVEALRTSCPKVPELLADPAYRDLVDGTHEWVLVVAMDMLPLLARIELLTDLNPVFDNLITLAPVSRRRKDRTQITGDFLEHIQAQLMGQMRALWEALELVCATLLEIDVRTVLQAEHPPLLTLSERFKPQWSAAKRNEIFYQQEIEVLPALWLQCCQQEAASSTTVTH